MFIDWLGHQNLSGPRGTLEAGGKIHDWTYRRKISTRLSDVADRDGSRVDADTHADRLLAFPRPDREKRGTALLKGDRREHRIFHVTVAFDREVKNSEHSITNQLVDNAMPSPNRFPTLFVEAREKPNDFRSVEKFRGGRVPTDVSEENRHRNLDLAALHDVLEHRLTEIAKVRVHAARSKTENAQGDRQRAVDRD